MTMYYIEATAEIQEWIVKKLFYDQALGSNPDRI